jgi:hypothetical protein
MAEYILLDNLQDNFNKRESFILYRLLKCEKFNRSFNLFEHGREYYHVELGPAIGQVCAAYGSKIKQTQNHYSDVLIYDDKLTADEIIKFLTNKTFLPSEIGRFNHNGNYYFSSYKSEYHAEKITAETLYDEQDLKTSFDGFIDDPKKWIMTFSNDEEAMLWCSLNLKNKIIELAEGGDN